MEETVIILEGHSGDEKTAYLGAIASIATADREASPEEMDMLNALCESASLDETQSAKVLASAAVTGDKLIEYLSALKESDLKYPLITDLVSFAKADSDYSSAEEEKIKNIAQYLGVDNQQFSLLGEVADKTSSGEMGGDDNGFLSGIKEKLVAAGINTGTLFKSVLAFAAPWLISKLIGRRGNTDSGMGGVFSGAEAGLGSVISMLNGGRGFGNAAGLLGTLFRRDN